MRLGKPEYTVVEGVTSVQVFSKIPNFTDFTAELVQIQPGFSVPTERYALGDIFVIVLDCADGELECLMGKDTKIPCSRHAMLVIPQGIRYSFYNGSREVDAMLKILKATPCQA
mmetsp:Transcript_2127/g.1782  ORF Transcript_2127/g.1782 Transcript_2127/m.1782 type:complete len:114 (+) Transcript_2127:3-344(+)